MGTKYRLGAVLLLVAVAGACGPAGEGEPDDSVSGPVAMAPPELHHVHLNSVDPEAAIEWYLRAWPGARRTEVDGRPAVEAEMFLLFDAVDEPPPGAWSEELRRSDPQSAFWHIGAFVNTTDMREALAERGIHHLPLFTGPDDTAGVWRSGLTPYTGTQVAGALADVEPAEPRDGGFSYVLAPDGALFEFTGGPTTAPSFSHIHFFHESPRCAANWYVEHLGMALPPVRGEDGSESARPPWDPCEAERAEATFPSLERVGTIRAPRGDVRFGNGAMSWYPRQCVRGRCGEDEPLARSRGQVFDHVAFTVDDFDAVWRRLRSSGVTVLEEPHEFGPSRAFLIEDPDGLAIELIDGMGARRPGSD